MTFAPNLNVIKLFLLVTHEKQGNKLEFFLLNKPFQSGLVFAGKAWSLPYQGTPIGQVGSGLTNKC